MDSTRAEPALGQREHVIAADGKTCKIACLSRLHSMSLNVDFLNVDSQCKLSGAGQSYTSVLGGISMTHVVITGSTRGLGFALALRFLRAGCNVTVSGRSQDSVQHAVDQLADYKDAVNGAVCDVRKPSDLQNLWQTAVAGFGEVDIWINNAGINQAYRSLWELSEDDIDSVMKTNLMGAVYGSKVAMVGMLQQGHGQIFNMEGFGSNDMQSKGLNLYGTTKRALTYYTTALAAEAQDTPILVGLLSPGMMVTDFITESESWTMDTGQTKKIFNILGDKPETVANFLVPKILGNTRNKVHFRWLTNSKAAFRFMKSRFVKRDLFDQHV